MIKKLKQIFDKADKDLGLDNRSEKLYGIAALFDTPDDIISAAADVQFEGYEKYDVHTPYPVHGMDDAMKLKPTRLGFFTFFFGAIGTLSALLMIWYMVGFDYKNIIGGKPFFNIPPSMPITFELTVLFAAIATISLMLILFNKLPKVNHPLIDTEYMKRVSSDRFGIVIQQSDPKFNKDEIVNLFKKLGSSDISYINYFEKDESNTKAPIISIKFILGNFVLFIGVSIITYLTLNYLLFITPFDWMNKQPRLMPQSSSTFFKDGRGMRNPVEGTVAKNFIPYEYQGMPDSLVKNMANPLPVNDSVINTGKSKFNIYCSPCHGYFAKGDSRLRGQFPNPPSLHTEKVRKWQDENIYHVITNGQNSMPSYTKQITKDERWAIIHYIRVLQRAQNANDTDIETK
jgi:mono/diheme cytochrome c family protein